MEAFFGFQPIKDHYSHNIIKKKKKRKQVNFK